MQPANRTNIIVLLPDHPVKRVAKVLADSPRYDEVSSLCPLRRDHKSLRIRLLTRFSLPTGAGFEMEPKRRGSSPVTEFPRTRDRQIYCNQPLQTCLSLATRFSSWRREFICRSTFHQDFTPQFTPAFARIVDVRNRGLVKGFAPPWQAPLNHPENMTLRESVL